MGGTDKARQIDKLASNQPHIVIGTPGRIYDLVKSGDLAIHKAKTFVIDEADMTLDMGFLETVDKIAGAFQKTCIHGFLSDYSTKTTTILEKILI